MTCSPCRPEQSKRSPTPPFTMSRMEFAAEAGRASPHPGLRRHRHPGRRRLDGARRPMCGISTARWCCRTAARLVQRSELHQTGPSSRSLGDQPRSSPPAPRRWRGWRRPPDRLIRGDALAQHRPSRHPTGMVKTDVLIIGAGACGLVAAALRALEDAGAGVVVVEQRRRGSRRLDGDVVRFRAGRAGHAGSAQQGIEDDPETASPCDIQGKAAGTLPIPGSGAHRSRRSIRTGRMEWLADRHGLEWQVLTGFTLFRPRRATAHARDPVPEKSGAGAAGTPAGIRGGNRPAPDLVVTQRAGDQRSSHDPDGRPGGGL